MGKTIILFGIGLALFVPVIIILLLTVHSPDAWHLQLILMIPGAIGFVLMILGAHYGLRRFGKYMDSD